MREGFMVFLQARESGLVMAMEGRACAVWWASVGVALLCGFDHGFGFPGWLQSLLTEICTGPLSSFLDFTRAGVNMGAPMNLPRFLLVYKVIR